MKTRKPSLFALRDGCVFKSNNYLPSNYFREDEPYPCHAIDRDLFDVMLNKPSTFDRRVWNEDCMMATMPKGSIVAMIMPNRKRGNSVKDIPGTQDVVFGTVKEDCFQLINHSNWQGFPFEHECRQNLINRSVKWTHRAKLVDLPGTHVDARGAVHLPWLLGDCPSCMMEIKDCAATNRQTKTIALQHLGSQAFQDVCSTDPMSLLDEAD
jgi:hypothetical protein